MSSGGDPGDRPAAAIGGKVNLARQPAPGPPERLPAGLGGQLLVIRPCPLCPDSGCDDLLGDIGGQQMAGTGGMLVSADHTGVDSDRPLHALGHIGVPTELVQDPHPSAVC
jgi:hypothetical protein